MCPLLHIPRIRRIISSEPDNLFCLQSGSFKMPHGCFLSLMLPCMCKRCRGQVSPQAWCMIQESGWVKGTGKEKESVRVSWDDSFFGCNKVIFHLLNVFILGHFWYTKVPRMHLFHESFNSSSSYCILGYTNQLWNLFSVVKNIYIGINMKTCCICILCDKMSATAVAF